MTFFLGATTPVLAATHTQDTLVHIQVSVGNKDAILIDVREPEEWLRGHLAVAQSLPLSELRIIRENKLRDRLPSNKIIYCHCLSGGRCLEASKILLSYGYDARALQSGYPDLITAGFIQAGSR